MDQDPYRFYDYKPTFEPVRVLRIGVRRSLEFIFDGIILISGLPMATYEFYKTITRRDFTSTKNQDTTRWH